MREERINIFQPEVSFFTSQIAQKQKIIGVRIPINVYFAQSEDKHFVSRCNDMRYSSICRVLSGSTLQMFCYHSLPSLHALSEDKYFGVMHTYQQQHFGGKGGKGKEVGYELTQRGQIHPSPYLLIPVMKKTI